ncbi:hypothetical protein [Bacillus atrophaeus]|uniref:hypothetical protein n=1 Tax=Bacillus atrophaeus TaxID=1452 RepID=UPI001C0F951F|nr:hypothetical protein [Bacillus atrophaeus]MBU5262183.1 hypothetical protein [Bacillus atrophaeus]MCY8466614.1 hypothetical protein [Bacillus atrophaeus]MCY8479074.1 hypothetical protein [Bacillus atrophaeus]
MKQSPEILAGFLQVLDEITSATQSALDTLRLNAETTRMIIDEMTNAAYQPDNEFNTFIDDESNSIRLDSDLSDEDKIEEMADRIIDKITSGSKIGSLAIYGAEDIDFNKVMDKVNSKMNKTNNKGEDIHESINFTNDFDNPFK